MQSSTRSLPSPAGSVTAIGTHDNKPHHVDHLEITTTAGEMPVSVANDLKVSLFTAIRQNPRLTLLGIWLMLTYLLFGYEIVFLGSIASLPGFQSVFGVPENTSKTGFIIPTSWLSIWSVSGPLGGMIGAFLSGWLQERIGRRPVLGLSGIIQAATVAICYLSDQAPTDNGRRGLYFVGKFTQGIAVNSVLCVAQTYSSEVLPPRLRGPVLAMPSIFTILGEIIGAVIIQSRVTIAGPASYRVPIAVQWAFSAIPLLLVMVLPESPAWLLRKGKENDAVDSSHKLQGSRAVARSGDHMMGYLREVLALEAAESTSRLELSYLDCFRREHGNLRRTAIVIFANFIPQLFGQAFLGHTTYVLEVTGMTASTASAWFTGGAVVSLVANLVALWLVTKIGRRSMLLSTLGFIWLMWLMAGIAGVFNSIASSWVLATASTLVNTAASLGAWPVSYIVSAEVSSLSLRAHTQSISIFIHSAVTVIFSAFLPYLYNKTAANLGGKIGFVYVGFVTIAVVVSWWIIPDMKDRTPAEIDAMFEIKLSARKFKQFSFLSIDEKPAHIVQH
ncbi:general substrate transporter [Trichoderma velutinum]